MKTWMQIATAAVVLLASCTKDTTNSGLDAVNQADLDLAQKAGKLYVANMELGRYVYDRTNDSLVARLAENLLVTSDRAYTQLIINAKGKGIPVPNTVDETHQAIRTGMESLTGWTLDSAFVHNALQDQHNLLAVYSQHQQEGNNATIKMHSRYYADTFRMHHDMADSLALMY